MLKNFSKDFIVCSCKKIELNELIETIDKKGLKTLRDIQESTFAGTGCRHCIIKEGDFGKLKKSLYINDILNEVVNG